MQTTRITIALVAGAVVTMLAGCTASDDPTPAPTTDRAVSTGPTGVAARPEPSRYLAILDRPASADDVLPDGAVDAPDDLVPNSQRRAAVQDGTTYWVGASKSGGACLLSWNADPDSPDNWAMCGAADIRPETIIVTTSGADDGRVVALVSDGFTGGDDLHAIAPNVWVS